VLSYPEGGSRIFFRKIARILKKLEDGQSPKNEDNVRKPYSLFVQPVTWSLQRSVEKKNST
jgi:hypothetical protein